MKKLFTVIISSLLFSFLFAETPSSEDAALTFFKKLYPAPILDVKIEIIITNPYKYLKTIPN